MNKMKRTVLVVDDDEDLRDVLTMALQSFGYAVATAEHTKKAREWLANNPEVMLIISDVMMPDGNGLDFCRWVRSQKALDKVPVILITGLADKETMSDALEIGAVDFLQKPLKMAILKEKIDRLRKRNA